MSKSIELEKYGIHAVLSKDDAESFGKLNASLHHAKSLLEFALKIDQDEMCKYSRERIENAIKEIDKMADLSENLFHSLNYCVSA